MRFLPTSVLWILICGTKVPGTEKSEQAIKEWCWVDTEEINSIILVEFFIKSN